MAVNPPRTPTLTRAPSGEAIAATSAVGLLFVMFAVKWYGVAGVAGPFASRTGPGRDLDAWHSLTTLRWLMLLSIGTALGAFVLRVLVRTRIDLSLMVTTLGGVTAVLLGYRVLIELPAPDSVVDQKIGAFLGVLSAVGIAYGGYESRLDKRKLARTVVQGSRN